MNCKTLGDLGTIITGKTPPTKEASYWNGNIPFITPKDIQITKHVFSTERCISSEGLEKIRGAKLPAGAICVSCIGNIGYVGVTTETSVSNQQINSIVVNDDNDSEFVFYLLKNLWIYFKNYEGQSTTLSILNKTHFSEIEVNVPEKSVQKKIAAILSCIDNKIELNQKINDNLQQQARMVYRQWMLENEEKYNLIPLEKIAEINPDTYSPKENWDYINYLDTSNITKGTISEIQHIFAMEKIPSRARRKVIPNDIVYSTVRPNQHHYGIIAHPPKNMLVSTGFSVIRSKSPNVNNELIYLTITENESIEKMQQIAEQSTSTFPAIKPSDLGSYLIPCPIEKTGVALCRQIKSIYSVIFENNEQNRVLSSIRDNLLPKLMSGEIDMSNIQL